jgi:DNA-binding NarL/FixJ family response regulator
MRVPSPPASDGAERLTTILVSGGSPLGRGPIVSALDKEDGFTVVGCCPHAADLEQLVTEHRPHIAVVVGDTDPLPAVSALTACTPAPRILVVSPARRRTPGEEPRLCGPPPAGAAGITVNLADPAILAPAIRLLRSGYRVYPARTPHAWERFGKLTGREVEVVHLMLRGWSNAEIAEALKLSGATVKSHVHSLMSKLQLRNRIDVITTAYTMDVYDHC